MEIAIIGAGRVGRALGSSLSRVGHHITYAATNPEHTRAAADAAGGSAALSVADAAKRADLVVLAVPFASAARDVAAELAPVSSGKIVIDSTNPLTPDMSGIDAFGAESAAEWFASSLGDARVVKAFNTLFAPLQADPRAHGVTLDAMFATDDTDARTLVAGLIRSLGLRPLYVGPLSRAHALEAMAFMITRIQLETRGNPLRRSASWAHPRPRRADSSATGRAVQGFRQGTRHAPSGIEATEAGGLRGAGRSLTDEARRSLRPEA